MNQYARNLLYLISLIFFVAACGNSVQDKYDLENTNQRPIIHRNVQIAPELQQYISDPDCKSEIIEIVIALDDSLDAWEMKSPKYGSGFKAYNDREHIAAQTQKKRGELIDSIIKAGIEIDREILENYRTSNMSMEFQYDRCKLKDLLKIPSLLGIEMRESPIDD